MRSASAIFMSCTESIMCLLQIITLHNCEERMGDQRGTKAVVMCDNDFFTLSIIMIIFITIDSISQ